MSCSFSGSQAYLFINEHPTPRITRLRVGNVSLNKMCFCQQTDFQK